MANIFDVEPPRWLQEIAKPIDTKQLGQVAGLMLAGASNAAGTNKSFSQGFQEARLNLADPMWKVRLAQDATRLQLDQVRAESALELMSLQREENRLWMQDIPTIKDFAAKPIEQQLSEPLTGLVSKRGNQMAVQMNRNASQSAVAKSMVQAKTDYDKRVAALIKLDPEAGVGLALPPNQYPRRINFASLELAEQHARMKAENIAGEAEIAARQRGDKVKTTISSDGKVTTTFEQQDDIQAKPEVLDLGGGKQVVYNQKGAFKIVDRNTGKQSGDLTPSQLNEIADNAFRSGNKAASKAIQEFLLEKAQRQISGKEAEAPRATGATKPVSSGNGLSFEGLLQWRSMNPSGPKSGHFRAPIEMRFVDESAQGAPVQPSPESVPY